MATVTTDRKLRITRILVHVKEEIAQQKGTTVNPSAHEPGDPCEIDKCALKHSVHCQLTLQEEITPRRNASLHEQREEDDALLIRDWSLR